MKAKGAGLLKKRLLSRSEAAEYLGIGVSTLKAMAQQGIGPEVVPVGKRGVRYDILTLDEWIKERSSHRTLSRLKRGA
jgi:excisionase family DNA binding protein